MNSLISRQRRIPPLLLGIAGATLLVLGTAGLMADDGPTPAEIANAIQTLQPATEDDRAARLARIFHDAGNDYEHDPLLLVAIAYRESSLLESVEEHRRRGPIGELGLMQSHGAALTVRPDDCDRSLRGARCQVATGAAWLAYAREQCGGSWWRWVAAYGMSECPTERRARTVASARVARRYYDRIGGTNWR